MADFSFTNAMGEDGNIFKESAAVFDLDIVVPAGVNYPTLTVSFLPSAKVCYFLKMSMFHAAVVCRLKSTLSMVYQIAKLSLKSSGWKSFILVAP